MMLKFLFCIFGLLSFVSSLEEMYAPDNVSGSEKIVCLECEAGYHIEPQWAVYGDMTTDCASPISLQVVRDRCYGMRKCSIEATYTLFGDPCWGVQKKLTISYICVRNNARFLREKRDFLHSGPLKRVVELQTMNLICSTGYTIHIMWANYGLQDLAKCHQKTSTAVVRNICDGRESCSVEANNNVFGDPCSKYAKLLDVIHKCVRNQTIEPDELCGINDKSRGRTLPPLY